MIPPLHDALLAYAARMHADDAVLSRLLRVPAHSLPALRREPQPKSRADLDALAARYAGLYTGVVGRIAGVPEYVGSGGPELDHAARIVAAEMPAAWSLPSEIAAMPAARWIPPLRRVGWPLRYSSAVLPQYDHRTGERVGMEERGVVVVPESWLKRLAEVLGVPWAVACRGVVRE